MTNCAAGKPSSGPNLGRFGSFGRGVTPQQATEIEALGYGAVWVGGSPPAALSWVEPILQATTTLCVATGIVNIWSAPAQRVAESFHRIEAAYPGRFLLGIGVGHAEMISEYRKPYNALVEYLDRLDDYGVPANRRVVAALGPRVLGLFRNNWKRLGFTDDEVSRPGSDRLVDAVVAYGTPDAIAARLNEHLLAGADHVPIQVLTEDDNLVSALTELAKPLRLT